MADERENRAAEMKAFMVHTLTMVENLAVLSALIYDTLRNGRLFPSFFSGNITIICFHSFFCQNILQFATFTTIFCDQKLVLVKEINNNYSINVVSFQYLEKKFCNRLNKIIIGLKMFLFDINLYLVQHISQCTDKAVYSERWSRFLRLCIMLRFKSIFIC